MKGEKLPIRAIIDTNLWVSFLIGNRLKIPGSLLINDKIELVISAHLLKELLTVCARPKFKKYFNTKLLIELI